MTNEKGFRWTGYQFHPYDVHDTVLNNWILVHYIRETIENPYIGFVITRCDDEESSSSDNQVVEIISANLGRTSFSEEE